jgi:hypothetical protein
MIDMYRLLDRESNGSFMQDAYLRGFAIRRTASQRTQLAPFSLHDVVQVTVVPVMQASHTSTHWLRFLASNFLCLWAMQARC